VITFQQTVTSDVATKNILIHHAAPFRPRPVEIIVPGLIDDPQQPVPFGLDVSEGDVDFSLLQRRRIIVVSDANDQLFCSWFHHRFFFFRASALF
jgi:hypothetical protein